MAVAPSSPPSSWDHLRGALVLLHVVALLGMAMPAPKNFLGKDPLSQPKVAEPLKVWEKALAPLPPEALRAVVLYGGRSLAWTRNQFITLSKPYSDWAGVYQSWRMFGTSPATGDRPEWWIEENGSWRLLYRPLDPQARWRAGLWEDGRVRGLIPSLGNDEKGTWGGFARSLARRAAIEFPKATRLKIQRVPLRFPSPTRLKERGKVDENAPRDVVVVELLR